MVPQPHWKIGNFLVRVYVKIRFLIWLSYFEEMRMRKSLILLLTQPTWKSLPTLAWQTIPATGFFCVTFWISCVLHCESLVYRQVKFTDHNNYQFQWKMRMLVISVSWSVSSLELSFEKSGVRNSGVVSKLYRCFVKWSVILSFKRIINYQVFLGGLSI